jgi:acetyl-CoA acetyltransferase
MLTRNVIRGKKITVAPTWNTVVIYDATARQSPRPHFGKGLTRYAAQYQVVPFTAEDAEWWAAESNRNASDYSLDDYYDAMADEATAQDRLDRGYLAHELAEQISLRSVIGH